MSGLADLAENNGYGSVKELAEAMGLTHRMLYKWYECPRRRLVVVAFAEDNGSFFDFSGRKDEFLEILRAFSGAKGGVK